MDQFLNVALSFPAAIFTVLLGVALVYWLFVIVGAAHVNLLGEGVFEGAADGALDGVAKGALEGATKGVLEGAAEHLDAVGTADGIDGGAAGLMNALRLRAAPATVVLSVLILFSWMIVIGAMQLLGAFAVGGSAGTIVKLALLVLVPVVALFPTSIVIRPLAKVFTPPPVARHESLVGKICTIRTGTVTDRFGEATLEDGGAGFVVRVRIDAGGDTLARGDQALIVGYDADRQEFTVAPMVDEHGEPEHEPSRRTLNG